MAFLSPLRHSPLLLSILSTISWICFNSFTQHKIHYINHCFSWMFNIWKAFLLTVNLWFSHRLYYIIIRYLHIFRSLAGERTSVWGILPSWRDAMWRSVSVKGITLPWLCYSTFQRKVSNKVVALLLDGCPLQTFLLSPLPSGNHLTHKASLWL